MKRDIRNLKPAGSELIVMGLILWMGWAALGFPLTSIVKLEKLLHGYLAFLALYAFYKVIRFLFDEYEGVSAANVAAERGPLRNSTMVFIGVFIFMAGVALLTRCFQPSGHSPEYECDPGPRSPC